MFRTAASPFLLLPKHDFCAKCTKAEKLLIFDIKKFYLGVKLNAAIVLNDCLETCLKCPSAPRDVCHQRLTWPSPVIKTNSNGPSFHIFLAYWSCTKYSIGMRIRRIDTTGWPANVWRFNVLQFKLLALGIEVGDGCTGHNMTTTGWETDSIEWRWWQYPLLPFNVDVTIYRGCEPWRIGNGSIASSCYSGNKLTMDLSSLRH